MEFKGIPSQNDVEHYIDLCTQREIFLNYVNIGLVKFNW